MVNCIEEMSPKPRVLGYMPLYYGAEYLDASLRSMLPWVDKLIIVYVDRPSQGHFSNVACPESKDQLQDIVRLINSPKIEWHNAGPFTGENAHRSYILQYSEGYDLIFTLDADEVCEAQDMPSAIEHAIKTPRRHIGINGFVNFWKSFDYACYDGFRPYRFVNLRVTDNSQTDESCLCKLRIYHFSTCQKIETINFKWNVSGHKNELKPGWIEMYKAWTPARLTEPMQDLHPVSVSLWNAVPFDKSTLPDVLKEHPRYNKGV